MEDYYTRTLHNIEELLKTRYSFDKSEIPKKLQKLGDFYEKYMGENFEVNYVIIENNTNSITHTHDKGYAILIYHKYTYDKTLKAKTNHKLISLKKFENYRKKLFRYTGTSWHGSRKSYKQVAIDTAIALEKERAMNIHQEIYKCS